MKKYLLNIVLLSFSLFAQSQTLKETQDWLKQKIESYGTSTTWNSGTITKQTNKVQEFDFVNNEVVIEETEDLILQSGSIVCNVSKKYNSRIAFNKITTIEVQSKGIYVKTNGNQISLQTKFLSKVCSSEQANQMISVFQDNTSKTSSYYIAIDFSKEDNLSERFQKAINRLLSFIPKQKEAF